VVSARPCRVAGDRCVLPPNAGSRWGHRVIQAGALLLCLDWGCASLAAARDLRDPSRPARYFGATLQSSPSPFHAVTTSPGEFRLPWELFAHCNTGCSDLRIADGQGQEIPYQLETDRASSRSEGHEVHMVENSFATGKYTQIVGDLGRDAPFYDRVRIETPLSDFIVWAEVALSDDVKNWRIVEPRAPIARFRKRSVDGTQTIAFRGLNSRYIRVHIFEREQQFDVTGLTVLREESHPARLDEAPARFQLANSDDTTETAWTANLASGNIPVSRVQFAAETPEFYRAVRISGSEDGKIWSPHG